MSQQNEPWPDSPAGLGYIAEFNTAPGPTQASRNITVTGLVTTGGMVFNPSANTAAYLFGGTGTIQFADGALISIANGASSSDANKRIGFNGVLAGSNVTIAKTVSSDVSNTLAAVQLFGNNAWTGTLRLEDRLGVGATEGMFVQVTTGGINTLDRVVVGERVTLSIQGTGTYTVPIEIGTGTGARGAIRFDTTGATLAGAITLRVNSSVSANTDAIVATISGNIGEIGGLRSLTINQSGTQGTVVLSGNNTFTGGVVLNSGILRVGSNGALNSGFPNVITFGPTTTSSTARALRLNGFSVAVGGLTLGNAASTNNVVENFSATAATLTIESRGNFAYSGVIRDGTVAGILSLTKSGTGSQTLSGANTYTGNTTISAGTLTLNYVLTASNVVNNTANASSLILQGGTLRLEGGASTANSQRFNGLSVQSGASTIQLAPSTLTARDLSLSLGAISRTGGYVNFILPGGTQTATNGITTTSTNNADGMLGTWATVNGRDWAAVNGTGNIVAFEDYDTITNFSSGAGAIGPIPNDPTAHVKIVNGGTFGNVLLGNPSGITDISSLVVSASSPTVIEINNFNDPTQGTLRLGVEGAILLAEGAGTLTIGDEVNSGGSLTAGGTVANTPGTLVINNSSVNALTVNVHLVDNGTGAVSLVKNGTGTLVLNSTSSTYTGRTFFNGGTVLIADDRSLGAVPGSAQASSLTFNGGALQFSKGMTLNQNRGILLEAGGGTLNTGDFSVTYGGIISGTGDLIKNGGGQTTGELTLTGANTYSGDTIINAGSIVITNNQALGTTSGGTTVMGNAMLRLTNGLNITGETITIIGNGNNNGALNLIGGATIGAATAATWGGDVLIGSAGARIGVNNFGTLTVSGTIRDGASNSLLISATGNGGVVLLTANNTYSGSTGIVRGTLRIGVDNSLPTGTVLTVYTANSVTETTAFDLNGRNQTIAGLSSVVPAGSNDVVSVTNSVSATASTLTINQASNTTYNGKFTGNLNLVKEGSGTLTLTNTYNASTPVGSTSTFTGKTTISGGTLALSGTGNLQGTPWIQVDSGATFSVAGRTGGGYDLAGKTLSGSGAVTGNITISGTGGVIKAGGTAAQALIANAGTGTGTLTFNGDLTLAFGGVRSVMQLGGTTSSLFNPDSNENPGYFAGADGGGLYDQIRVNGTLNLFDGGIIKVEFVDGYIASAGDVFNLLDWVSLGSGNTFDLSDLDLSSVQTFGNGLRFETDRFLTEGILYVAVPEPTRALLLLGALACIGLRRRRQASTFV